MATPDLEMEQSHLQRPSEDSEVGPITPDGGSSQSLHAEVLKPDGIHTNDALSALEEANLHGWYSIKSLSAILFHPSKDVHLNHQRRRAYLFSVVAFALVIFSTVSIALEENSNGWQVFSTVLLAISYLLSRTKYARFGTSLGAWSIWLLPFASNVKFLLAGNTGDLTVTDSINWLYTPCWYLLAALFLSRSMTTSLILGDTLSLLILRAFAGSFYQLRQLYFFHACAGGILVLCSLVHFRDKLQLLAGSSGEEHPDHRQAGKWTRMFFEPSQLITNRIFRRRSRVLSVLSLTAIPCTIIWAIYEFRYKSLDKVVSILAISALAFAALTYGLSRTQYTRWASRLCLLVLLAFPYIYVQSSAISTDDANFCNLLTTTSTTMLGIALLSGTELICLALIMFFPTFYSPYFPPHVVTSIVLLLSARLRLQDKKEIEDTCFGLGMGASHGDEIPWEKRYLCGQLKYIQMIRFFFACQFGALTVLTILGLQASPNGSRGMVGSLFTVNSNPAGGEVPDYYLYIHALDCPSNSSSLVTIVDVDANILPVPISVPLVSNQTSTFPIYLDATVALGDVAAVRFQLGAGDWTLTEYEQCLVNRIDLLDVATKDVFSSSDFTAASEDTQTRRMLLRRDRRSYRSIKEEKEEASKTQCDGLGNIRRNFAVWKVGECSCTKYSADSAKDNFFFNMVQCYSKCLGGADGSECCGGFGACISSFTSGEIKTECECFAGHSGDTCGDRCTVGAAPGLDGSCSDTSNPTLGKNGSSVAVQSSLADPVRVTPTCNPRCSYAGDVPTAKWDSFLKFTLDDIGGATLGAGSTTNASTWMDASPIYTTLPPDGCQFSTAGFTGAASVLAGVHNQFCSPDICDFECARSKTIATYHWIVQNLLLPGFLNKDTTGSDTTIPTADNKLQISSRKYDAGNVVYREWTGDGLGEVFAADPKNGTQPVIGDNNFVAATYSTINAMLALHLPSFTFDAADVVASLVGGGQIGDNVKTCPATCNPLMNSWAPGCTCSV